MEEQQINNENTILAEKTEKLLIDTSDETLGIPDEPKEDEKVKKPRGRPKKPINNEELDFKRRVAEETEKAYREVIETKIKSNIKRELKNKALENEERYKDPEPKAERPKKVLSEKQMENLAKGREIAIARTKNKRDIHKQIDEEVKVIKEAKKNIRKTLLVDRIRDEVDGLDSDEDEEVVIQKKPKTKKLPKYEEPTPNIVKPTISFY
jgi:hypothetical protein